MAISEAFSGTQSVGVAEHSMTTDVAGSPSPPAVQTDDGVYQAFIDFNALAAGDVFQFKVYEKVLSSSLQRVVFAATISGAQGCPVWPSPTLILIHGWDMTLMKLSGTDRSIDWSIRKVA